MQKIIISLSILCALPCYGIKKPEDAKVALTKLYQPIPLINSYKEITDTWLNNWHNAIVEITKYAIINSKNLIGAQDMSLIGVATLTRDVNDRIIKLYRFIRQHTDSIEESDSLRNELNAEVKVLQIKLKNALQKLEKKHTTRSKINAQRVLIDTITFLNFPVLNTLEQELMVLDSSTFL